ncbi:cupredoxin domain-containing protein [Candidatus Gottesmanbacteria bacterium]|nr:cupredoxin domain-containing protein [Candidatus Gottesmanbacteria bacterium]
MNKNMYIIAGVGVLFLVSALLFTAGKRSTSTQGVPQPVTSPTAQPIQNNKTFSVEVKAKKMVPDVMTVNEGDTVTVSVTSNEAGDFHITGYDLKKSVVPGNAVELTFTADKAGRYEIEFHPGGKTENEYEIGALVVNPK